MQFASPGRGRGRAGTRRRVVGLRNGGLGSRRTRFGIHFHAAFDVTLLARSTPKSLRRSWVQPDYLTKAGTSASPWDPKWQRLNMREINQELDGFLKR